jgi:hypothetical protein
MSRFLNLVYGAVIEEVVENVVEEVVENVIEEVIEMPPVKTTRKRTKKQ